MVLKILESYDVLFKLPRLAHTERYLVPSRVPVGYEGQQTTVDALWAISKRCAIIHVKSYDNSPDYFPLGNKGPKDFFIWDAVDFISH